MRPHLDLIAPGWDVVLIARQPIGLAAYADIEHTLTRLLGAAELLSDAGERADERME